MNFQAFETKSIQLAEMLLTTEAEETKTHFITGLKAEMAQCSHWDDSVYELIWSPWSQSIMCSINEDTEGMNKHMAEITKIVEELPAVEAAPVPEPKKTNWGMYVGSMVVGGTMAILGGPGGMAAGYAVAKGGTIAARHGVGLGN